MVENILIARLSVAVTIHRLAHGGVASAGHVATSPNPVDPIGDVLPRLPSDVAIVRVRRGATAKASVMRKRLYAVRASKVIDALRWLKAHNPYYSDVTIDRSRIDSIPEGAEKAGAQDWDPGGPPLPEDNGPAPDQAKAGRTRQAACFCLRSRPISATKSESFSKQPATKAIEGRSA